MIFKESERLFGRRCVLRVTERPEHATMMARHAVERDARLIVVVGGDGTINEVLNGLFSGESPINPDCHVAIISCGTGHGLAQSLHLPKTREAQLELACVGQGLSMDLGSITVTGWDGSSVERIFASECQVGLGGAVVAGVCRRHKVLGGRIAFGFVALNRTIRCKACTLDVIHPDGTTEAGAYLGLTVGNGPYCGGGMKLLPNAQVDDGHLDTLLIHDMSLADRLVTFSKIYSGGHIRSPFCSVWDTTAVSVHSEHPVMIAADGELLGTTPCRIKVLPEAIRVRRPSSDVEKQQ